MQRLSGLLIGLGTFILIWGGLMWPNYAIKGWRPLEAPDWKGVLQRNRRLEGAYLLGGQAMLEPEDVLLDRRGNLYGSCKDGKIRRIDPKGKLTVFANTGGRPLGMAFDVRGNIIVADKYKGLLAISSSGRVRTLANKYKGERFGYPDAVAVAKNGDIYFSDATTVAKAHEHAKFDILAANQSGRLFRYRPGTGKVTLLLDKLSFANGVAMAPDQRSVLVTETGAYRIQRYWLKGPKAGASELFAHNLPGLPDNINAAPHGGYWVALISPRVKLADRLLHPNPWLKEIALSLPSFLLPNAEKKGIALKLDKYGRVVEGLHDPYGRQLPNITSIRQYDSTLYFGHIYNNKTRIGRLEL